MEQLAAILATAWPDLVDAAVEAETPQQLRLLSISRKEASEDVARAAAESDVKKGLAQECEITLRGGTKAVHTSLTDALADRSLATIMPQAIRLHLRAGALSIRIAIGDRISVDCYPPTNDRLSAIGDNVLDWVDAHAPNRLVRLWHEFAGFPAVMLACSLPALLNIKVPVTALPADHSRERAASLLVDGVTSEEVPAALELLLQKSFGLPEQVAPVYRTPNAVVMVLVFGGLLALLLLMKPVSCIGIGKGQARCRLVTFWIKALGILLPTYVVGSLVMPTLWSKWFA